MDGVQEEITEKNDPDVVETYSASNLRPNEDEIQLLRLKLEEAQCKNRVIQEEMNNLKSKINVEKREQAVGNSDPEDNNEEEQESKAKEIADQEVNVLTFFGKVPMKKNSALHIFYQRAKKIRQKWKLHKI